MSIILTIRKHWIRIFFVHEAMEDQKLFILNMLIYPFARKLKNSSYNLNFIYVNYFCFAK
jgi:hypothetical protein